LRGAVCFSWVDPPKFYSAFIVISVYMNRFNNVETHVDVLPEEMKSILPRDNDHLFPLSIIPDKYMPPPRKPCMTTGANGHPRRLQFLPQIQMISKKLIIQRRTIHWPARVKFWAPANQNNNNNSESRVHVACCRHTTRNSGDGLIWLAGRYVCNLLEI